MYPYFCRNMELHGLMARVLCIGYASATQYLNKGSEGPCLVALRIDLRVVRLGAPGLGLLRIRRPLGLMSSLLRHICRSD